jgi:hypothetical protein
MLLPDTQTALVSQFSGAVPTPDSYAVDAAHALYARNIRFIRGLAGMNTAGTRLGHSQLVQIGAGDGPVTSMTNWYFVAAGNQISVALYYCPAVGIRGWQQSINNLFAVLIPATGAGGAVIATAGQRFYAAFYDATGRLSAAIGQVYGYGVGADPLFAAPVTTVPVITQPGVGKITAGIHRIGFLTTTRNGYTGTLQPVNSSGAFVPVSFTADGAHNVTSTVTFGSLPTYLQGNASLQVVMTTAVNLNRWFTVPGARLPSLVVGANVLTFSITDDDLAATGTDVTSYLNLLTSSVAEVAPFTPSAVFTYSGRMGYVAIDSAGFPVVYISDPNAYQKLTADQHGIYLDGQAKPVHGVSIHEGILFIAANNGFYSCSDNGGVPVSWTPPKRVDGSVGIQSPTCLLVNAQSGFILVASTSGLFVFQGGVFPELPISHHQKVDWLRINWAFPTQVQVAEDSVNHRFHVLAPITCQIASVSNANPAVVTTVQPHLFQTGLSVAISGTGTSIDGTRVVTVTGASTFTVPLASGGVGSAGTAAPQAANAEMVWNYSEGYSPDTVQYSLKSMSGYRPGAMAAIQNTTNALSEIWYAPAGSNPGCIIRQNIESDPTPYRDVNFSGGSVAIDALYQTSNLPGAQDETGATVHDFHGAHFRVSGSGGLNLTVQGLDGVRSLIPTASPVTLSRLPGLEVLVKWFLRSEQETISLGSNAVDAYFIAALIRAYYTGSLPQR